MRTVISSHTINETQCKSRPSNSVVKCLSPSPMMENTSLSVVSMATDKHGSVHTELNGTDPGVYARSRAIKKSIISDCYCKRESENVKRGKNDAVQ